MSSHNDNGMRTRAGKEIVHDQGIMEGMLLKLQRCLVKRNTKLKTEAQKNEMHQPLLHHGKCKR
jgi:hypothetical protein